MTWDLGVAFAVGGLAVLCLVLLVAFLRLRASSVRSRAEVDALRERLARLEDRADEGAGERAPTPPSAPFPAPAEFVITDLGNPRQHEPEPVHLDGPTFVDILLKETVVKTASLAVGLRRGLAPATRNRIRFEMKQEVRRARKQRRADLKAAQRELRARQRAALLVDHEEAS